MNQLEEQVKHTKHTGGALAVRQKKRKNMQKTQGYERLGIKGGRGLEDDAKRLGSDVVHCCPKPTKLWDISAVIANLLG